MERRAAHAGTAGTERRDNGGAGVVRAGGGGTAPLWGARSGLERSRRRRKRARTARVRASRTGARRGKGAVRNGPDWRNVGGRRRGPGASPGSRFARGGI